MGPAPSEIDGPRKELSRIRNRPLVKKVLVIMEHSRIPIILINKHPQDA